MPKPMRDRIGMGGVAVERTFDAFESKAQPEAYRVARSFLDKPRTIVFSGPNGVGKTHLALAIGNAIIKRNGLTPVRVMFINFQDMLRTLKATFQTGYEGFGEQWHIDRWRRIPVLIMDEVGQKGLDQRPSEFTRRVGYDVIDGRYRVGNRPVILTTNKSVEELGEWITESAVSRLFEMGDWVTMEGEDWRLTHQ